MSVECRLGGKKISVILFTIESFVFILEEEEEDEEEEATVEGLKRKIRKEYVTMDSSKMGPFSNAFRQNSRLRFFIFSVCSRFRRNLSERYK